MNTDDPAAAKSAAIVAAREHVEINGEWCSVQVGGQSYLVEMGPHIAAVESPIERVESAIQGLQRAINDLTDHKAALEMGPHVANAADRRIELAVRELIDHQLEMGRESSDCTICADDLQVLLDECQQQGG